MRMLPYPRTVRARLTLWNVLVLGCVLLALGGILRTIVARNLLASVDADLIARAAHHVGFWANMPPQGYRSSPLPQNQDPRESRRGNRGPNRLQDRPWSLPMPWQRQTDGHTAAPRSNGPPPEPVGKRTPWQTPVAERVYDLNGRESWPAHKYTFPWDRHAFDRAARGQATFSEAFDGDIPLRVYSAPLRLRSKQIAGVAQIASSTEQIEHALSNLDKALLTLVPLGLAAAWGGGMFLTGRMLRPLREVTRAAGHIGVEDLSKRLAVGGEDEFSELAATFNGMLARLEVSFEQQRRFTADASHELRTPLTVIKSVASRFLSRKDLPEDYRRGMERLDRAAAMMDRVVRDLLLLARSDAGRLELHLCPTPLAEVLDAAIACMPLEGAPTLRNEVMGFSHIIHGDQNHLTRLFMNLLDNSVRHTPAAGSITVSSRREGAFVVVTIADTGTGIPAEHLPYITERFYRLDEARARAQGGTGLGLTICRSIVEAHGGEMHIESVEGQGTTVVVFLHAIDTSRR